MSSWLRQSRGLWPKHGISLDENRDITHRASRICLKPIMVRSTTIEENRYERSRCMIYLKHVTEGDPQEGWMWSVVMRAAALGWMPPVDRVLSQARDINEAVDFLVANHPEDYQLKA